MQTSNLVIVYKRLDELRPAEYNPRQMTRDQAAQLRESITTFGLVDPFVVNKHPDRVNVLVGGHQRMRIAQELGYTTVPCVEVKLDEQQEKELNIRLNKNTGEWDWDILANNFDPDELIAFGFKDFELGLKEDDLQFTADEAAKLRQGAEEAYDDHDLELSHVRLVQIYLDPKQHVEFLAKVDPVREAQDCSVSDAVMFLLRQL